MTSFFALNTLIFSASKRLTFWKLGDISDNNSLHASTRFRWSKNWHTKMIPFFSEKQTNLNHIGHMFFDTKKNIKIGSEIVHTHVTKLTVWLATTQKYWTTRSTVLLWSSQKNCQSKKTENQMYHKYFLCVKNNDFTLL